MLSLFYALLCPAYASGIFDLAYAECGCAHGKKKMKKPTPAKEDLKSFSVTVDMAVQCENFQELGKDKKGGEEKANDFIGAILYEAGDETKPWIGEGHVKVEDKKTHISGKIDKSYTCDKLAAHLKSGLAKICAGEKVHKDKIEAQPKEEGGKKKGKRMKKDCYICGIMKHFKEWRDGMNKNR